MFYTRVGDGSRQVLRGCELANGFSNATILD
jgi:hypothetical protein